MKQLKEGNIYEIVAKQAQIEHYIFEEGMRFKVIGHNDYQTVDIQDISTQKIYRYVSELGLTIVSEEVA